MMNFRERLLAVFAGEKPDHLPWFADLLYYRGAHMAMGDLPERYCTDEGFVQMHRDYHAGMYLGFTGAVKQVSGSENVQVTSEREGATITTRWETPVGEMWGEHVHLPHAETTAWTRYPVTSPDDLRIVRYLYEGNQFAPDHEAWERGDRLTGDQGCHVMTIGRGGISSLLAEWCGVMNVCYLMADAPQEMDKTVAVMLASNARYIDCLLDGPGPLVEFCDNLTGEVVTRLFKRYQFDFYQEQIRRLHEHGKKTLSHVDGTLKGIVPLMAATGLDAAESVTPMPCGDVAVADLRELAGPDLILFGGMPGAILPPLSPADDIKRQVESVVEHHWEYGKFVLGAADQIPPDSDIDLVRLTGELCEELT
jgi:hypothetical protein